jgi:hypothetical protein
MNSCFGTTTIPTYKDFIEWKSSFNPTFCQNEMFLQENIDLNMTLGYIYMEIDHQIDEKHHFVT